MLSLPFGRGGKKRYRPDSLIMHDGSRVTRTFSAGLLAIGLHKRPSAILITDAFALTFTLHRMASIAPRMAAFQGSALSMGKIDLSMMQKRSGTSARLRTRCLCVTIGSRRSRNREFLGFLEPREGLFKNAQLFSKRQVAKKMENQS